MGSHNYDSLRHTWIYQEIQQQIQTEEAQRQQETDSHILIAITQARFPRLLASLKEIIETHTHPSVRRELIIQIGSARTEKEARQHLLQYQQPSTDHIQANSI